MIYSSWTKKGTNISKHKQKIYMETAYTIITTINNNNNKKKNTKIF